MNEIEVKRLDLCSKCAALMKEGYEVRKVSGSVCEKVTCGRRRYGGTYEVQSLRKERVKT